MARKNQLYDEAETVKGFCYLGDTLNASGGCETAVALNSGVARSFEKAWPLLKKAFKRAWHATMFLSP